MLKHGFKKMLAEANAAIETIAVKDLPYHLEDKTAVLVDVRDAIERETTGSIPGSVHVSRGLLEFHADPESAVYNPALAPESHIVLYCGTGGRSALAAKTLLDMGFSDVSSLSGGYAAWRAAEDESERKGDA